MTSPLLQAPEDRLLQAQDVARLHAVYERLYDYYPRSIDLSLDRTYRFLSRIGDPHLRLKNVVHIAGTNGKGSTLATLRALLEAAGHKVHTYTSPHLVSPTERIRLAGSLITPRALADLLEEVIALNQNEPITHFELFTVAAYLAFTRVPADYILLETGMGGRVDTTNVIPAPIATIITTISYDHMQFLGNTLPDIAYQKAGIMKPGVPCIISYQTDEAIQNGVMDVFQRQSQDLSPPAPLLTYGAEWVSASESHMMLFRYGSDSILTRTPNLQGSHQIWNAGAALAAFKVIAPDHFKADILSTGLGQIDWPGRLQTLDNHPFNALLPQDWIMTIDGGHNDTGGLVVGQQMNTWKAVQPERPIHLVVAMVNRKDPTAFLRPLVPYADSITLTTITGEPSAFSAEDLAKTAKDLGFQDIGTAKDARDAVVAVSQKPGPARVLMTGSLYFMGNILSF